MRTVLSSVPAFVRSIALCVVMIFAAPLSSHAAYEKIIDSRSGIAPLSPIVSNASITIADQWYSFMQANPLSGSTPWTNTFVVPNTGSNQYDAFVNAMLRYDDSRRTFSQYDWEFTLNYTITTFAFNHSSGAVTNSGALNGSLDINYRTTGTYKDKAVIRYPEAFKAELTITSCTLTVHTTPNVTVTYNSLPAGFEDIYLDLEQETQRIYKLNTAPVTGLSNVNLQNELEVNWGFVPGAESYDLEWLFIDEPLATLNTVALSYDFRNATRVNIPNQHYAIPLAYPRGILLYRVRGVGKDPSDPDLWVEGDWSFPYESGFTNDNNTAVSSTSFKWRYHCNGLEPDMNWQYAATYAEDGKRKETISFFDGSLRNRQSETFMNTENNLIVGETKYDYEGRPVVQILPVPLSTHTGLSFYPNLNPNFDRSVFGTDATIDNPGTMSTSSGSGQYYSASNPASTGFVTYTPNASGYAYAQTRYKTDGTGRVSSSGGPGDQHHLGSGHETKYFYGSPTSQDEIDRLFGNEVGNVSHYQKNMVVDANGQVSVSYLDQEGRVIASSLAGDVPDNLLPVDGRPQDETYNVDLLLGRNRINADNTAMVSSTTIICTAENTDYNFSYTLGPDTSCSNCFVCKTCLYDLQISVLDEFGQPVADVSVTSESCTPDASGNPVICHGIGDGNYQFTAQLDVGSYTITKTLALSESSLQTYADEFTQYQLNGLGCVHPHAIHPESCGYDCATMCFKKYTWLDEDGFLHYMNDLGEEVNPTDGGNLIEQCETNNCGSTTVLPDQCTIRKSVLLIDMSPGGQYFENASEQREFDTNGELIDNPNYDKDAWLEANVSSIANFWDDFDNFLDDANGPCGGLTSLVINNWDDVRANWQDCFAEFLIQYHPEYCAWQHYCGTISCKNGTLDMAVSNDFDADMYSTNSNSTASSNGYFNPSNCTGNSGDLGAATDNSTYIGSGYSNGSDPYFSCDVQIAACSGQGTGVRMNDMLKHFFSFTSGSNTYYYSIWYVLDDPDDIVNNGTSSGAPQDVVDYFRALHGYGSTPGLIGTGNGQISKYEYFRSVYMFYKQFLQYALLSQDCSNMPLTDADYNGETDLASNSTNWMGYQIRYPKNQLFDTYINASPSLLCTTDAGTLATVIDDLNTNLVADQCTTNCEANADTWMGLLSGCTLDATQKANIRNYLIQVCVANCDGENYLGSSGSSTGPGVVCSTCSPSQTFHTFDDVISYFSTNTCNVSITWPETGNGGCSCGNFNQYLYNNGLTSSSNADIATFINNDLGTTVSAADVADWITECAGNSPQNTDLSSSFNFPAAWICTETDDVDINYNSTVCTCENISHIINQMGFDVNDPADEDAITAGLNAYLAPSTAITETNWKNWLEECANASPSMIVLNNNNLPSMLACPVPVSSDEEDVDDAAETASCMQSNLYTAMGNAVQQFYQELNDESSSASTQVYLAYMRQNCLNNLAGRETFSVTYTSNEFLYTLYYYDQAGTLIKTVPPAGVVLLTATEIDDVQDYRAAVTGSSFTVPAHTMVTRYKYNSLQQLVWQKTPDGGETDFYYDVLGRAVASQNDKQAAYSSPPSYSYVLYDNLGRPYEAGELKNSTPLTDDIARGKDATTPLATWMGVSVSDKKQVVQTFYDEAMSTSVPGFGSSQENLRGRVSSVIHFSGSPNSTYTNYDNAYHYSYDIHGNVTILSEENTSLNDIFQSVKLISYEYDLISGNVNAVHYQSGYPDQFHFKYEYDADNRLTNAYTSRDQLIWEKEAKYFYYPTGMMARTEIGEKQVQGTDYAFTITGLVKGVNSDTRTHYRDIGRDGNFQYSRGLDGNFAQDAYGYSLRYYEGDYTPITAANANFLSDLHSNTNNYDAAFYNLYNGNIAGMITALTDHNESQDAVQGRAFRYDQLNRIKQANAFQDANLIVNNYWGGSASDNGNYYEEFLYDFNGNILNARRNGNLTSTHQQMDLLTYNYTSNKNQLTEVIDNASSLDSDYGTDINSSQASGNYQYDEIGNLKSDASEEIDQISWTPQGKIAKITRNSGSTKADLEYIYDAMGQRTCKISKPRTGGNPTNEVDWTYTYYQRDPQGNVLAVYTREFVQGSGSNYTDKYDLTEQHIYGSARIGLRYDEAASVDQPFTATGFDGTTKRFTGVSYSSNAVTLPDLSVPTLYERTLGYKAYELVNYLGNVLETVSDRKLATAQTNALTNTFSSGTDSWAPDVATVTHDASNLRLKISATLPNAGTVKTITTSAWMNYTESFTLDVNGYGVDVYAYDVSSATLLGKLENLDADGIYSLTFTAMGTSTQLRFYTHSVASSGYTVFYLDDIVLGDANKVEHYVADVVSWGDYYTFGSSMPGRNGGTKYRFDFNGKETDAESDLQDYGMRIYNAALAKFLSVDPLTSKYPELTPYQFASNTPVQAIDLDGLENYYSVDGKFIGSVRGAEHAEDIRITKYTYEEGVKMINTTTDYQLKFDMNSQLAYTMDQEEAKLIEWAKEWAPQSTAQEYGMMIYSINITNLDAGINVPAKIPVFLKGQTITDHNKHSVGILGSKLQLGDYVCGVKEYSANSEFHYHAMIHTHVMGCSREFSVNTHEPDDISMSRDLGIPVYMAHHDLNRIKRFSPSEYKAALKNKFGDKWELFNDDHVFPEYQKQAETNIYFTY